jgi:hypothetical protein
MCDIAMEFDQALYRYRQDRFTDQDVTRCTGLSVRAWRELIKLKAVRTEEEKYGRGPGRIRTCDAHTLKRAAVISALHQSGLSLAVAGQIAHIMPLHTLLYAVCDPLTILFQYSAELDPNTGLPPRLQRPMAHWFDPGKPAIAEPDTDWLVEIFDGRFVGVRYDARNGPATIFGDLRQQATRFIGWLPFPGRQFAGGAIERMAQEVRGAGFIKFIADYEDPAKWLKKLHGLGYRFENHDGEADPLRVAAESAAQDPIFKITVNVTLVVRKALRRYLGIEPPAHRRIAMKPPPGEGEVAPRAKRRRHPRAPSDASTADASTARHGSSGEEYRVGPGRPPREYQFKPGQSGNPKGAKGKSKLLRDLKAVFERALNEKVKRGERSEMMTKFEAGCKELATQFAEGDHRARRDVFDFAAKLGIDLTAGRGSDRHVDVSNEAELRQVLLDRGIPARLLPPIDEAGLEPPPDPPLPPEVEKKEKK